VLLVGVSLAMLHADASRKAFGVSGLVVAGVALVGRGTLAERSDRPCR
jgi:hypothetical protein